MSGRFLAAPFLFAVILLSQFELKSRRVTVPILTVLFGYALIFPHNPLLSSSAFGSGTEAKRWYYGVADERAGWYQSTGLLNQSFDRIAPHHQWVDDGLALKDSATFINRTGIGFLSYFSGPKVHIVDGHGLANPLPARLPARDKKQWRIGHFHHIIPDGYVETIKNGTNRITDSSLARYYDKLSILTKGKIWSVTRFKEIIKFNLSEYRYLIDQYLYDKEIVNYDQFSQPKKQGTHYKAPGCKVLYGHDSLTVRFDQPVITERIEVSVDHNDDYGFEFFRDTTFIAQQVLLHRWIEERGLRVDTLTLSEPLSETRFNRIVIKGTGGDQVYSIGHLRIIP